MKVGELKELLRGMSDATEVIMASDSEANAMSPLHDVEKGLYSSNPDVCHYGDFKGDVPAVYLYPSE